MVENMNEDEAGVIKVIAIASNLKRVFLIPTIMNGPQMSSANGDICCLKLQKKRI